MLTMLAKLLKALNSESAPWQIALALALSMIIGLTPLWSLHNLMILLLAMIIRVNISAFSLGILVFTGLGMMLIDTWSIELGEALLMRPDLQILWTELYAQDFWRMLAFNHTLTLGGLCIALIAFIPVFFISLILVRVYRQRVLNWVNKLKITQILKASKFYGLYQKLAE